ncbi:MAG TPA: hypothetical protein VL098_13275, partial [Flavipsychrobacter sp.]|nr:hypothetical protein [Flavipsychrobacter sp.]
SAKVIIIPIPPNIFFKKLKKYPQSLLLKYPTITQELYPLPFGGCKDKDKGFNKPNENPFKMTTH